MIKFLFVLSSVLFTQSHAAEPSTTEVDMDVVASHANLTPAQIEECSELSRAGKYNEARALAAAYKAATIRAEAEEARLNSLPHDCLGGTCLNIKSLYGSRTVATVAQHKWERVVEVCSGRIVDITLVAIWASDGLTIVDVLPQAVTKVYTDGNDAVATIYEVQAGLATKGWIQPPPIVDPLLEQTTYINNDIRGYRVLRFDKADLDHATMWQVTLYTRHEDYNRLCAAKKSQGL